MKFMMLMIFSSCTMSLNIIHTQGKASDVVDETQSPQTQVSPDIHVPIFSF